jgi:hypothetical protein
MQTCVVPIEQLRIGSLWIGTAPWDQWLLIKIDVHYACLTLRRINTNISIVVPYTLLFDMFTCISVGCE